MLKILNDVSLIIFCRLSARFSSLHSVLRKLTSSSRISVKQKQQLSTFSKWLTLFPPLTSSLRREPVCPWLMATLSWKTSLLPTPLDPTASSSKPLIWRSLQVRNWAILSYFMYIHVDTSPLTIELLMFAGTSCALVGESGHGKSTIVGLVERFYDTTDGKVRPFLKYFVYFQDIVSKKSFFFVSTGDAGWCGREKFESALVAQHNWTCWTRACHV